MFNAISHYSAHEIYHYQDDEKKTKNKAIKNKTIFTAKTQYLNLKAPSNNVKKQSKEP